MSSARHTLLLSALVLGCLAPAYGEAVLYRTDFEEFPVGDNLWAGSEGWLSNDTTSGAQGIVADIVPDLEVGKTAYLGFEEPAAPFTTVFRPMNYDPAEGGEPEIVFESLLGVQDSTNSRRDNFFLSFYNIKGEFLAAVKFDNASGTVRCTNGLIETDTKREFLRGDQSLGLYVLQVFHVRINLPNNSWSADLDGIPLFNNISFTATEHSRTLGAVAAEWLLNDESTSRAGDNWLWVADWAVHSAPKQEPFILSGVARDLAGCTTIQWIAKPGYDYKVEYSSDLNSWNSDLPNSFFSDMDDGQTVSFTDEETGQTLRYYRVVRTMSR